MLAFHHPQGRFNYRTAAVLLDRDRVLVHQIEGYSFWALPGGRVEFGESSEKTIVREMVEELGVAVQVERLLWLAECFFTFEKTPFHEIA
ncbi:MAG: NUDIX domain-containing protein, partial [Leptolyngbyaceae cyanobacterium bins.59]|nr:NUDIX domain-containing protein [Leptolyngbyaceae cyanobacterium bins.59]